jgi:transcriptional regulator NrdR family protein
VLKEQIEHHVYEEERQRGSIFSQVRKADIDLDQLGEQMAQLKQQLQEQAKADSLPAPELIALRI